MNILVINGSPKGEKSNTYRLTRAFLDGISAREVDQAPKIEVLEINKMNIKPCLGCFSCFTKIPLTAHYSKNGYNGDAALRNPLFRRLWAYLPQGFRNGTRSMWQAENEF